MAVGKRLLDALGRKVLFTNGKTRLGDSDEGCCCCPLAPVIPECIYVTFSGVTFHSVTVSPDTTYYTESGTLNGTWALAFSSATTTTTTYSVTTDVIAIKHGTGGITPGFVTISVTLSCDTSGAMSASIVALDPDSLGIFAFIGGGAMPPPCPYTSETITNASADPAGSAGGTSYFYWDGGVATVEFPDCPRKFMWRELEFTYSCDTNDWSVDILQCICQADAPGPRTFTAVEGEPCKYRKWYFDGDCSCSEECSAPASVPPSEYPDFIPDGCCDCDPDLSATSVAIDFNGLDLSACSAPGACTPDTDPLVLCRYVDNDQYYWDISTDECALGNVCIDGREVRFLNITHNDCDWTLTIENAMTDGVIWRGTRTGNGPQGAYTKTAGCATGSVVVS